MSIIVCIIIIQYIRSRQKIATRLGKIDDILTVSTSPSSFHTPRYSSTPLTAGSKSLK